jgi:hypothetical protein
MFMNDILDDLNGWLDLLAVERRFPQQRAMTQDWTRTS